MTQLARRVGENINAEKINVIRRRYLRGNAASICMPLWRFLHALKMAASVWRACARGERRVLCARKGRAFARRASVP